MRLLLFLGSGSSLTAGYPSVDIITRSILEDKWHEHADKIFYPEEYSNPQSCSELIVLVKDFLSLLMDYADSYYEETRYGTKPNYEDIYYMCRQIADESSCLIDNPAIFPFYNDIKSSADELRVKAERIIGHGVDVGLDVGLLAETATHFIESVVWNKLKSNDPPKGLDLVKDLARSKSIDELSILTLNHDLLIERTLNESKIEYCDGFTEPQGDIRHFMPSLFDKSGLKVKLYKLHGSISWFSFIGSNNEELIGSPLTNDYRYCKIPTGDSFCVQGIGLPLILCGSYNKYIDYGYEPFTEIHNRFSQLLRSSNIMAMSGYGWNDSAINNRLFSWLESPSAKTLIVMHEGFDKIRENSKSAMRNDYDSYVSAGRLKIIEKWLCNTSLDERSVSTILRHMSEKFREASPPLRAPSPAC